MSAKEPLTFNGVGDEAVTKATGKPWSEWLSILDAADAVTWPHPQIARWLAEVQGVPDWWSQMVTVGYEQARGLRKKGQKVDGFSASLSRTLPVALDSLYAAAAAPGTRAAWLGDAPFAITTATENKSIRGVWGEDGRVDLNFYAKGAGKSQITVQVSKLPDEEVIARHKALWGAALDRLKELLT